jgi:plastocyanin domain-containing protein
MTEASKANIPKPCDNDITKLHSEINQYINQRLVVTTNAITLFGVVIGWIVM